MTTKKELKKLFDNAVNNTHDGQCTVLEYSMVNEIGERDALNLLRETVINGIAINRVQDGSIIYKRKE